MHSVLGSRFEGGLLISHMCHWLERSPSGQTEMRSNCVLRWERNSVVSISVVSTTKNKSPTLGKSGVAPLEVSVRVGQVETLGAGCRAVGEQVCEKSIPCKDSGDSLGMPSDRTGVKYWSMITNDVPLGLVLMCHRCQLQSFIPRCEYYPGTRLPSSPLAPFSPRITFSGCVLLSVPCEP